MENQPAQLSAPPQPPLPGLYLLPNWLQGPSADFLSPQAAALAPHLAAIVAEGRKAAQRWLALNLKWAGHKDVPRLVDAVPVTELDNGRLTPQELKPLLALAREKPVGLISDAGYPCVADPGAGLVRLAHQAGVRVVPVPGASALLLALAASGFGGQRFAFQGYLPVKPEARKKALADLERRARQQGETQLMIETPYRNGQLLQALKDTLQPGTWVCVAQHLGGPGSQVYSMPVQQWRSHAWQPARDQPAVFLLAAD